MPPCRRLTDHHRKLVQANEGAPNFGQRHLTHEHLARAAAVDRGVRLCWQTCVPLGAELVYIHCTTHCASLAFASPVSSPCCSAVLSWPHTLLGTCVSPSPNSPGRLGFQRPYLNPRKHGQCTAFPSSAEAKRSRLLDASTLREQGLPIGSTRSHDAHAVGYPNICASPLLTWAPACRPAATS